MKFALVDGALGHTGSFLVKNLLDEGWKVVATDLKMEDRNKIMTKEKIFSFELEHLDCRDKEGVTFISADLTKKESLKPLFSRDIFKDDNKNYDVIFHPASLYDYGASYELLHLINYGGLKNLLDTMLDYSKKSNTPPPRFIHWSTCGVYGEPLYQKDNKGFIFPIDESAPFNPPNNYSQTKIEQEKLIFKTAQENPGFKFTILRSAPIYGPYQTYGMYHLFYGAFKMGHSSLHKIYPKKKKLLMPLVHVEDLVKAAIFLAEKDKTIGEVYNVLSDSPLQEHWLEFLFNELGITFTVIPYPWFLYKIYSKFLYWLGKHKEKKAHKYGLRPKIDLPMIEYITHQYYFSNKKIKELGFQFKWNDWKKGTRETIRWYIDKGWFFPEWNLELPNEIHTETKSAIKPKIEYKTPMEGGEIF